MSEPKTTDPMIAALLREREGYLRAGKADRVAAVNEQLAVRGYHDQEEPDRSTPPRQRQARPKQRA